MEEQQLDPEILYINACLERGEWTPLSHGFNIDDFVTNKAVALFCDKYTGGRGESPSMTLLKRKFPHFEIINGVAMPFAISELRREITSRRLSNHIKNSARSLAEGNLDHAVATLRQAVATNKTGGGISIADESLYTESDQDLIPVPGQILTKLVSGISPGQYWVTVGRAKEGKSMQLMRHAHCAAAAGWDIVYFSLEMNAKLCKDRMNAMMVGHPQLGMDRNTYRNLVCEWMERHDTTIRIVDPSAGIITPETVARYAGERTLLLVDYAGLMHSSSGEASITDWRIAASISNGLRQVSLSENTAIIAAAQMNRAAGRDPDLDSIGQTVAYGQDADVVHILHRTCEKVTLNKLAKNRNGISGSKWFSMFDPSNVDFSDISSERAAAIKAEQESNDYTYQ